MEVEQKAKQRDATQCKRQKESKMVPSYSERQLMFYNSIVAEMHISFDMPPFTYKDHDDLFTLRVRDGKLHVSIISFAPLELEGVQIAIRDGRDRLFSVQPLVKSAMRNEFFVNVPVAEITQPFTVEFGRPESGAN